MALSLAYLGDAPASPASTPATTPVATPPPSERSGVANALLFGGIIGGAIMAIVGNMMGQHRLLTQHVFKNRRRRTRRRS